MTGADLLVAPFVLGLANAAHCAGMCGVFALQAASPLRFGAYAAGKTFTYVALGVFAGALGARLPAVAGIAPSWLALGAGVVLAVAGVVALLPRTGSAPRLGFLAVPWLQAVAQARRSGSAFVLGAVTGAIPCGVVYLAAASAAATASPVGGALAMASFGAGTLPALALVALAGNAVIHRLGPARIRTLGAALVLATGVVLAVRAGLVLAADGDPACCD